MHITFDVDETITKWNNDRDYENFVADEEMVRYINELYDAGHIITLYTSRGMRSCGPGKISIEIVPGLLKNLDKIGLKYHNLLTHKPYYDWIVDDKAMRPDEFKKLMYSGEFETKESYRIIMSYQDQGTPNFWGGIEKRGPMAAPPVMPAEFRRIVEGVKEESIGDKLSRLYSHRRKAQAALLTALDNYFHASDKICELIKEHDLPHQNNQEDSLFSLSMREYPVQVRQCADHAQKVANHSMVFTMPEDGEKSAVELLTESMARAYEQHSVKSAQE